MQVTIRCYGRWRVAIGERTVSLDLDEGATVGDALASLVDLDSAVTDGDGPVVLKEGTNVRHLDGRDTPLSDGDTVALGDPISE